MNEILTEMNQIVIEPIIDKIPVVADPEKAMRKRTSRRAFTNQPVEMEKIINITEMCREVSKGHFSEKNDIYFLDKLEVLKETGEDVNKGFGRNWFSAIYPKELLLGQKERIKSPEEGIVKALPRYFLVAAVGDGPTETYDTPFGRYEFQYSLVSGSAEFYKCILAATEQGLKSCISGLFVEEVFKKALDIDESLKVPLMSPIGYSPEIGLIEERIRKGHKSYTRLSFDRLFFNMDGKALSSENIKPFDEVLEYVRKGPSAGNHQSWRMFKDNNTYHLFVVLDNKRADYRSKHLNEMDAGIAIVNFGYIAKKRGIEGQWQVERPRINLPKEYLYVASFAS